MALVACDVSTRKPFLGSRADPMECTACGRHVYLETDPASPLFDRVCLFEADVSPMKDGLGRDCYQKFKTPTGKTVTRLIDDRARDPCFGGRHHWRCLCSNTLEVEFMLRGRRAAAARRAALGAMHSAAAVEAAKRAAAAHPVLPASVEAAAAAADAAAAAATSVHEDGAAGGEYTVEAILGVKAVDGKPHYLIKWEAYNDEGDNTWEPEDHLDCQALLGAFQATQVYTDFEATLSSAPQPADAADAPAGERRGGYVCNACFKELKRCMPDGRTMRPHKLNGVAGVDCTMGAELPALTVAAAAKLDRKDPEGILQRRVQQNGRKGTISKFSKQTGYCVSYDSHGDAGPTHRNFGILEIRELLHGLVEA
jgi:uncharacterized protein (DUF2147 family)|tara:strand:- start:94 stop:1197 length:1104 start_codon:yes stop_codon:yes gene_type:complete